MQPESTSLTWLVTKSTLAATKEQMNTQGVVISSHFLCWSSFKETEWVTASVPAMQQFWQHSHITLTQVRKWGVRDD